MKKKLTALITSAAMVISAVSYTAITSFADTTGTSSARQMEYLDRGLVAVDTGSGVYLSWRLLGYESLEDQAFDIYRDGSRIYTTGAHDATCYTDSNGTASSSYIVVPAGESISGEKAVTPWNTNKAYTNGGFSNSVAYKDILFDAPEGGTVENQWYSYKDSSGNTVWAQKNENYTYSANDMSVGDLDGDGEYELIVKWDPSNSQDNSLRGFTSDVYIDAYKLDGTRLWRMDLGCNIRAGAHYTQFIVYDFDGDGKSEIAFKTAPGSKDGNGNYVSAAGKNITIDSEKVTTADPYGDTADYRNSSGYILDGPEWLTIFNGETGAALQTIDYDPPRNITSNWGDTYGNRVDRFLAGVAYLDGKTPSLIITRGYYTYAYAAAYTWDGTNLTQQWLSSNEPVGTSSSSGCTVKYADGTTKNDKNKTLYGQGAHSLSVADVDNDGYDEIIFGSAILDHDGTVLLYDGRGHGDAEHVSDFDNDGQQEIFMVHEEGKDNDGATVPYAVDIKRYNGDVMTQAAAGDIGRGVMANIDDDYALSSGNLAAFWSVADGTNLYNQNGEVIGNIPNSNNNLFENFFIYWDGDLGRELLDGTMIAKQDIDTNATTRIYYDRSNSSFPDVSSNNDSKKTPGLVADIFGDWREEVVYPLSDGTGARIYFSTIPTTYRLTTLMHDSQYRCAIAWQNVGYNQPPHTSYYIGSAALAKNGSTSLNYLDPAVEFTEVTYPNMPERTPKPTAEPNPDVETVTADADTYLVYNDTAALHGSDTELKINMATDMYSSTVPGLKEAQGLGLIRFDLSQYSDRELLSAELQLYDKYTNSDNATSQLFLDYCSEDNWNEATLTADDITIRGTGTPFSSLGLSQTPPYNTSYSKITFDVTDAINADSDNVHTFALWTYTAREQVIASKEYTGTDAEAPTLILTFASQTPAPTEAPTPIPTPTPTEAPTSAPTDAPTLEPTEAPTPIPTVEPTSAPTNAPTDAPTSAPTDAPTDAPIETQTPATENPIETQTPSNTETPIPTSYPEETPVPTENPGAGYIADYNFENKYATIHCNTDQENVIVIFASYDDGKLINVKTVKMDLRKDTNRKPMATDFENGETVKIFVWESLEKPNPIMDAKEFSSK